MQILSFAQDDSVKRRAKRMQIPSKDSGQALHCVQDDREENVGAERRAGLEGRPAPTTATGPRAMAASA